MKGNRTRRLLGLLAAQAMLLAGGALHAQPCVRASEYTIDSLTLEKADIPQAFEMAAKAAGYKVVSRVQSDVKLSAQGLGGPLDVVLDHMAEQAGIEYRIERCALNLYAKGQAPSEIVFTLKEGEPIHEELIGWAQAAGWRMVWSLPSSWRVFAAADFRAENVVKAVGTVIETLRDEGKPVRLAVYEGNRVMEVVSSELSN